uniref:Uncharacterized protein n=1 Tax=Physcomitrium patens TaxID=3218 RepID=A0A2K1JXS0_PHYPA|nr:hypothetical protein PHYPA_013442 [Physcomitrium patens]
MRKKGEDHVKSPALSTSCYESGLSNHSEAPGFVLLAAWLMLMLKPSSFATSLLLAPIISSSSSSSSSSSFVASPSLGLCAAQFPTDIPSSPGLLVELFTYS